MSTVAGITLQLLHIIPVVEAGTLEDALHDVFVAKRLQGEWFDLDDDDIAWLRQL